MDDEELIQIISQKLFGRLGHNLEIATNGKEAVTKYLLAKNNNTPYDLVILDLQIPNGDGGEETISKLLAIDPNVVAIVSSGNPYAPIMLNFEKYGFKGCLNKPINTETISSLLDTIFSTDSHIL